MKILSSLALGLLISFPVFSAAPKTMICQDTEFGAYHFKLVIPDLTNFFSPAEKKPMVKADFWIKGDTFSGILESALFMPDWGADAGWYRSSPSPLDFSLCNWRKCPVRKVKLMVHTKDQLKAEGNIKFLHQTADGVKTRFDRKLNCEIR